MAIDTIKRRKGRMYRVRLLVDGKRISKCFERKVDAYKFAQEAECNARIVDGLKLTFADAAHTWLENHARPRKAPGTVVNNEALIRKDLVPRFGTIKIAKVQPWHIDTFIKELHGTMSNASVNRRLELIRSIFNYHIRRRVVSYNPMNAVEFLKVDPRPMQFWTKEEATRFLKHSKAKYGATEREAIHLLYSIALNTGMRQGEILALAWTAVDLRNRLISVCRSKCHHTHEVRQTTKGRRIRHVPINDALHSLLDTLRGHNNNSKWVLNMNGHMLDSCNLWNRHWTKDLQESGVSPIRFHDLRHTYASHFMMNGGAIFKLQAILGHASIKTTMQYAHFSKAYIQENANIVVFSTEENVINVDFGKTSTERI